MPPARIAFTTLSRHQPRTIQRLPRIRQILLGCSRASFSQSHIETYQHPARQLYFGNERNSSESRVFFSTANVQRSKPKDAIKQQPSALHPAKEQQVSLHFGLPFKNHTILFLHEHLDCFILNDSHRISLFGHQSLGAHQGFSGAARGMLLSFRRARGFVVLRSLSHNAWFKTFPIFLLFYFRPFSTLLRSKFETYYLCCNVNSLNHAYFICSNDYRY